MMRIDSVGWSNSKNLEKNKKYFPNINCYYNFEEQELDQKLGKYFDNCIYSDHWPKYQLDPNFKTFRVRPNTSKDNLDESAAMPKKKICGLCQEKCHMI